jgi:hypothetical protein
VGQKEYDKSREFNFFYADVNENQQLETGLLVHHGVDTADKRVEFVSERMPYVVLRGHWCNIIFLNMHASK